VTFLEAKRLVDKFAGGAPLSFLLASSGSAEPFDLYLRAAAAKEGRSVDYSVLPFNTLAQHLRQPSDPNVREVFLLLPWDFAPEADWRSGGASRANELRLRESASEIERLLVRRGGRFLYLPAPTPPLFPDHLQDAAFSLTLESIAAGLGAHILPQEAFSLSGYFASGCPVGGSWIGQVAEAVVDIALRSTEQPKKVLVTDLDNVLWDGGIAEDGLEGIAFREQGRGYPHFIYQAFLSRLRNEGTLLAAVSRNDPDVALSPFHTGQMTLTEDDFVAIVASYHAKSAQISMLASRLNLGIDSFVFVDDNPVELAEVSLALPELQCVPFPLHADGLPPFLSQLASLFSRREITAEDRERTALYRRRLEGMAPESLGGADITEFLKSLSMKLIVHDRSSSDRSRAIQLINKTNQFNLNGQRVTEQEITSILGGGGRLYSASLSDRTGSHGEILACLVDSSGVINAFVMSCRVFQRRVEYAFLAWLARQFTSPLEMNWTSTPRNQPFAQFLTEITSESPSAAGRVVIAPSTLLQQLSRDLDLFQMEVPRPAA
jgi:FkbH-like protein